MKNRAGRFLGEALLAGAMIAVLTGCGNSSSSPAPAGAIDLRGSWDMVAVAGGVNYPQTMHLTTEELSTGKFSGTDVGGGVDFTVTGSVSGTSATFVTTSGGYTSNAKSTVSGSGAALTMTGTFTDTNGASGTFTAKRTSG